MSIFRQAFRRLWKTPGFSLAVIFSLVLCLGPNVATFSALYSLVVKPLPFPESRQLFTVLNVAERSGGQVVLSSTTQFQDFKAHADLFSGFCTTRSESATLDEVKAPRRVEIQRVSSNFFSVLGVVPVSGRFFREEEESAGKDRVLVLSESYWKTHYQSDPEIIGQKVNLGGQPFQVVGIAPQNLECLAREVAFFQPYAPAASRFDPQTRYRGDITLFGRLKKGVTSEAGLAQLEVLERNFNNERAGAALKALVASAGYRLALEPLRPGAAIGPRGALWVLQAAAFFVLLIGCLNVVNLFLARMNARSSDTTLRVALGASWTDLLFDVLAETFLLTTTAVLLGLACALAALKVFNAYLPSLIEGAPPVTLDGAVLGGAIGCAFLIAFIIGFVPLLVVYRSGVQSGGGRVSANGWTRRLGGVLVIGQVAFAVMLLVGAALLLRSFSKVLASDPGYDAARIVSVNIALPGAYGTPATRQSAQNRITEAFKTIPGVQNVATSLRAMLGNERPVPFARRGEVLGAGSQPLIHIVAVSPEFFETLGMPLVSGRGFLDSDDFSKAPVAIVDRSFVDRYGEGRAVEGQELYLNWGLPLAVDAWPRVIGVVERANLTGLDSHDNLPIVYVPTVAYPTRGFEVLVRTQRSTADVLRDMRSKVAELDPGIQMLSAGTLEEKLSKLLLPRRGITLLLGSFSGLALLLAAIGLYGMLSYDVSQRTREIGIRGAIGATRLQLVGMVMRDGLLKTGLGLALGLVGALFVSRYLSSLLFGVGGADAPAYAVVLGLLGCVSLFACWLPARRASKIEPLVALRSE